LFEFTTYTEIKGRKKAIRRGINVPEAEALLMWLRVKLKPELFPH